MRNPNPIPITQQSNGNISSVLARVKRLPQRSPQGTPPSADIIPNDRRNSSLNPNSTPTSKFLPNVGPTPTKPPTAPKRLVTENGIEVDPACLAKVRSYSKNLSPFDASLFLPMLKPCPRSKEGKITLILDIDETLVHSSVRPRPGARYDTVIHVVDGDSSGDFYVAFRPNLHLFLRSVASMFEVVVFTASQSCYADQLMDIIDPDHTLVSDRLFREHCTEVDRARVKDLSLLGRPLERMAIIDNSPVAYLFQPRNAIPILSWFDDPDDNELLKLLPTLRQLANTQSVYPLLDVFNARLMMAPL